MKLVPVVDSKVFDDLIKARRKAIVKHGDQDAPDLVWLAVQSEETGEVARAILNRNSSNAYDECLDAASAFLFHAEVLKKRGLN